MKIRSVLLLVGLCGYSAYGQELNKVVFVESAFKPIIDDAEKITAMPVLSDTVKPKPDINYSVLPSHIEADYEVKPIKPAKLVGSPLDKLYNSKLKLGLGNYTTPLAEFSINNLRSKEYSVGAYIYHKSSHTKLKLDNGHEVPAGYGKNQAIIYGKRFYRDFNLEGDISFNSHKSRLYGYNTQNFIDSTPPIEKEDIRQWYSQFKGRAEIYSTDPDSLALQYRLGLNFDYFSDDYSNSQNHLDMPSKISFMVESFRVDLNARFHYFQSVLDTLRGESDYTVQFRPILRKRGGQWEAYAGANTYYSGNSGLNVFPEAQLSYVVLENVMNAYFGISGYLELNHFSKIAGENNFITPGLHVKNTKHKIIGYGGVKGKISSNAGYNIDVSFDNIENMYFFVNDTNSNLENTFVPEYDDVQLIKLGAELWYSPFSHLEFFFKSRYYSYNMSLEDKPWHKPDLELTFSTQYNYKEKIYANVDVIHIGKRYAKNYSDLTSPITLKPVWDVNIGLEYKYSNVLSAFIDVHNLLSQQYYIWNQYPTQKINVMVGFSYKF